MFGELLGAYARCRIIISRSVPLNARRATRQGQQSQSSNTCLAVIRESISIRPWHFPKRCATTSYLSDSTPAKDAVRFQHVTSGDYELDDNAYPRAQDEARRSGFQSLTCGKAQLICQRPPHKILDDPHFVRSSRPFPKMNETVFNSFGPTVTVRSCVPKYSCHASSV